MSDSYKIYASQDWINEKIPETTESNQQLVTNSEGKAIWEEKPFGEGMAVDVVPLVTLTELDPDMRAFILPENVDLIADTEYTVSWNGTEYVCITHLVTFPDGTTVVALGDSSSITGGTSTGEPFGIGTLPPTLTGKTEDITFAMPIDGSTEVELKITIPGTKTLDNKYLEFMEYVPARTSLFKETMGVINGQCSTMTPVVLNNGEEYIVSWNGTEYVCVAQPYSQDGYIGLLLGDTSILTGSGTSTGEPFMVGVIPPEGIAQFGYAIGCYVLDGSTEVELEIIKDTGKPDEYQVKSEYLDVSWNDLSDKPFGEANNEGYISAEFTTPISNMDPGYIPPVSKEVIIGAPYIVTWNGTEYTCTAVERTNGFLNGSPTLGGDGFPFEIIITPISEQVGGWVNLRDNSSTLTSVTLSIRGAGDYIRKIDKEYLPELTASDVSAVPTTRTINGKALSNNITLSARDVDALSNTTKIPSNLVNGSVNSLRTIGSKIEDDIYKLGEHAFAEGYNTIASGSYSHAKGYNTTANTRSLNVAGEYNLTEDLPLYQMTSGFFPSYSFKTNTTWYLISGTPVLNGETGIFTTDSVSEVELSAVVVGNLITDSNNDIKSYYEIQEIISNDDSQYTFKCYRYYPISNTTKKGRYVHIVGNGSSAARSNAHTLDWSGLGWFAGGLKVGGTGQDDEAAVEVATKNDIETLTETVNELNKFIPFVKQGNNIMTGGQTFAEIAKLVTNGANKTTASLAITEVAASNELMCETCYAFSIQPFINLGTGETTQVKFGFRRLDGTIIKFQLNPDETITNVSITTPITEDRVNELIAAALAAIPNAEEASF